ncbi:DNA end-binding protein Ku [Caldibacillus debilis GB1]|jgi:DNA end-binding protein Ku|uniref:Non-homologous end joining protein Ku n=2 Tax=Caldibacillus debilis TaxID=301148 RepID=A0A420VFB7_9BACI|nr:DNA end-binding protein Ku [Caldibacillus debilis GB1]
MEMHTIWKGSLQFGLVNIPVKLHAATEEKDVKFRTLHKPCHTPIKYEKVCPNCQKGVDSAELVKAYEYTPGKFIVLEEGDLNKLEKEMEERAVEILDFVDMAEIDPIFFRRAYYLSPNEGGGKAYSLLRKALEKSKKVGIAKIMIRSKVQLSAVRVFENTLVLETIHFPDEVRKPADVPNVPAEDKFSDQELEIALLLIDRLSTEFSPEKYKDDYRESLLELIEAKKKGEEFVTPDQEEKPSAVTDLLAALQASIDRTKPEKKTAGKKGGKLARKKA